MSRYIVFILLLILIPDLFIWWNYTRHQPGFFRTLLLFLPSIIAIGMIGLLLLNTHLTWLMQMCFILLICIAIPKLVFVSVAACGKLFALQSVGVPHMATRIGVCLALVAASFQLFGVIWGWRILKVAHTRIDLTTLPPAFEGYKIVQISDLHLGSYAGDTTFVAQMVDSINRLQPDLIVFTGDLINATADEALPYVRLLRSLKATDGIYSILGNHDFCVYHPGLKAKQRIVERKQLVRLERLMGWHLLQDEHVILHRDTDSLYLAGVSNIGKRASYKMGNLARAMNGIPNTCPTLLLSHDPWHWKNGVVGRTNIVLTLSGHTHAMQLQVGHFSPATWFNKQWGGLYENGQQRLFVSTGVGGNIPYRLGAWPKIEMLTLHHP